MPGQLFEPLTHASQAVAAGYNLDAAPIVMRRQRNAIRAALDRDPEIPGVRVPHGVGDDFLHASQQGMFLNRVLDGDAAIDVEMHLRPWRRGRERANRQVEIRVVTVGSWLTTSRTSPSSRRVIACASATRSAAVPDARLEATSSCRLNAVR